MMFILLAFSEPLLVEPNVISTEATEVRLAVSPDGTHRLWGTIGRRGGPGGFDIWESRRDASGTWSRAAPVSFNSAQNDFDPSFAPDGSGVYFFSNRAGGLGGDDIYFSAFRDGRFAEAVNLGSEVNTPKDEWAPCASGDGKTLLFATDGRGGRGKHDLFLATRTAAGTWGKAQPLSGDINSALDDYDATFFADEKTIIFTREVSADASVLMMSRLSRGQWSAPVALGPQVNTEGQLNFGPSSSASEPGVLYFSAKRPHPAMGRIDIYRVRSK